MHSTIRLYVFVCAWLSVYVCVVFGYVYVNVVCVWVSRSYTKLCINTSANLHPCALCIYGFLHIHRTGIKRERGRTEFIYIYLYICACRHTHAFYSTFVDVFLIPGREYAVPTTLYSPQHIYPLVCWSGHIQLRFTFSWYWKSILNLMDGFGTTVLFFQWNVGKARRKGMGRMEREVMVHKLEMWGYVCVLLCTHAWLFLCDCACAWLRKWILCLRVFR